MVKKLQKQGNKAIVQKSKKAVIKKLTIEETKNFLNRVAYLDSTPEEIMRELSELVPKFKADKSNKKIHEQTAKATYGAVVVYGLDTHFPLAETVDKRYRSLAIEFSRQLVREYNCQTVSEKALAEIIVSAYTRILQYSEKLRDCIDVKFFENEKNGFYTMLSKELDKANRHFITALTTLKQIKTPSLEVNVKTKTAFVAQNQQLNIGKPNNENIEPK